MDHSAGADLPTSDDADLVGWLQTRHVPCPLCGYDLNGLTTPRCPECGQSLQLGVSLADPYLKAWVALLVALLLPAGFGIVIVVGFAYSLSQFGPGNLSHVSDVPPFVVWLILYLVGSVPASGLAIAGRRRFQRWRRRHQVVTAAVAWALLAATIAYPVRFLF